MNDAGVGSPGDTSFRSTIVDEDPTGQSPNPTPNPDDSGNPTGAPTLVVSQPPSRDESATPREVTLTATASDPEGEQITYTWSVTGISGGGSNQARTFADVGSFTGGNTVTGSSNTQASVSFMLADEDALNLTADFSIIFLVRARDASGMVSDPDTATLLIRADEDPPVITAITPVATELIFGGVTATTLTATVLDEHVGEYIYDWSITAGGERGTLTDADTAMPTFTIANAVVSPGTVTISLTVTATDGQASAPMTTVLNVGSLCASYTEAGADISGTAVGGHCTYDANFVANVLDDEDLTLMNLPGNAAHIFTGNLVVGRNADSLAALAGRMPPIMAGGNGPTLTIEAGVHIAFSQQTDLLLVNRGSQILARGTADNPITFTSDEDAMGDVGSTVSGQWGGIIIAGFALEEGCEYQVMGSSAIEVRKFVEIPEPDPGDPPTSHNPDFVRLASDTPVLQSSSCSESNNFGIARNFGGDSDTDNSGVLTYIVIKHAGGDATVMSTVAQLDALSLEAVGSATEINNIQVFAAGGHGINIQGGHFFASNFLIYNARRTGLSIIYGGYLGAIDRVLVSQPDDSGGVCVSAASDGSAAMGGANANARNLQTRARVTRLLCDLGDVGGEAFAIADGAQLILENTFVHLTNGDKACVALDDDNLPSGEFALTMTAVILSCNTGSVQIHAHPSTTTVRTHTVLLGDPTGGTSTNNTFLAAAGSLDMRTLFSVPHDATRVIPAGSLSPLPRADYAPEGEGITFLGAITAGDNPFASWTFGVFTAN